MRRPTRRNVQLNRKVLSLIEWAGSGTPIVFLPGAGGNGLLFADLAATLPRRRIIAVDPPGFGHSEVPDSHDLVETVGALADVIGRELDQAAVWIGHSWGGKAAALLAARHPDKAAATILIDPSPAIDLGMDDDMVDKFVHSIWEGADGPWASEREALSSMRKLDHYRNWTPNLEAAVLANLVRADDGLWRTRAEPVELRRVCDATLRVNHGEEIAELACPTLYLVASESGWWQQLSNDQVMPAHVERVELPGNHFLYYDNLQGVTSHVHRFLEALDN